MRLFHLLISIALVAVGLSLPNDLSELADRSTAIEERSGCPACCKQSPRCNYPVCRTPQCGIGSKVKRDFDLAERKLDIEERSGCPDCCKESPPCNYPVCRTPQCGIGSRSLHDADLIEQELQLEERTVVCPDCCPDCNDPLCKQPYCAGDTPVTAPSRRGPHNTCPACCEDGCHMKECSQASCRAAMIKKKQICPACCRFEPFCQEPICGEPVCTDAREKREICPACCRSEPFCQEPICGEPVCTGAREK